MNKRRDRMPTTTITGAGVFVHQRFTAAIRAEMLEAERSLIMAERDALSGSSDVVRPPSGTRAPDDADEPPTGHVDPTGDLAASGAVAAVRARRTKIIEALRSIDHAVAHFKAMCEAVQDPHELHVEASTPELCLAVGCNRRKAHGEFCDMHYIAAGVADRALGDDPRCHWPDGCAERVEQLAPRKDGTYKYRHMVWDVAVDPRSKPLG